MKYYIVALFDEESYNIIAPIQRNFSKKFRANKNSPIPYITLDILENPNIDKLIPVIEKVLSPYKKFKIELCDNVSVCEYTKTLNLKIEGIGYIKKIFRSLADMLQLHGFNLKTSNDDKLSISLANMNYYNKDNKRYDDIACDISVKYGKKITLKISKIELWKMSSGKKETPIKSFELKDF